MSSIMFQGGPDDPPEGTLMPDPDAPPPTGGGPGGPPSLSGSPSGGPEDALREAIDSITRYLELEEEDEDIAKAMKHLSGLQDLLAKQQSEMDGLLGGKAPPRALRRATRGAQAF